MAELLVEDDNLNPTFAVYSVWRACLLGLVLGLVFYGLMAAIDQSALSVNITGDVAAVLTATIGVIVMVRLRMAQPLIISLASCLALWGLSGWIDGLSTLEAIIWSVVFYGLCYTLFSWVSRYSQIVPVLLFIILIITAVRIIISL